MKLKTILSTAIAAAVILTSVCAYGENIDDLKAQQRNTESKLKSTQSQLNQAKNQKNEIAKTISGLDKEINSAQSSLDEIEDKIKDLDSGIKSIEKELSDNSKLFQERKELLKARLKAMYINCNFSYLDVIVEAKDFSDFISKIKLVDYLLKYDKQLITSMEEQLKLIKEKKLELEEQKSNREKEKSLREERIRTLNSSRAAKDDYLKKLNANIKQLEMMEDLLLEQSEEITKQIQGIVDKSRKYENGRMVWPAPSAGRDKITSPFGMRFHPILKQNRMHTGIDIGAAHGTDIIAASKGKVIFTGYESGGYGNYVILEHGFKDGKSITTLYAHASKILVKVGTEVEAGTVIAKVGTTGASTGPHLHFEVRLDGSPVNPLDYL